MKTPSLSVMLCLTALTVAGACSDPTGASSPPPISPPPIIPAVPTSISAVPTSEGQTALVGSAVPLPLQVRVMRGSTPAEGVEVAWQASVGALVITSNITDGNGLAYAGWVLGDSPGPQTASASVADARGSPITFHATALDYVTATQDPISEGQSGMVGTELAEELRVVVTSRRGREANVPVVWATTGGTATPTSTLTDVDGVARARWTLARVAGSYTATATVARTRAGPLVFHAAATPLPGTLIEKVEGSDSQAVPANFPGRWLGVRVTDAYGNLDEMTPITWSVVDGSVTIVPSPWSNRSVQVVSGASPGVAHVRAAIPGGATWVDFTYTVLPPAPAVILQVGAQTAFLSRQNGTNPAVDTIAVGGKMTWFLSDEDLDFHAIAPVGEPGFIGGGLGYGGTMQGLSVTFPTPGTYHYEDPYYPGAIGTLVVR